MSLSARKRFILHVTIGYLVFGSTWIFLSDRLLLAFADISTITELSTIKGIAFILLTALLLFFALWGIPDRETSEMPDRHRTAQLLTFTDQLPGWIPYVVAVAVTAAILLVRMKIAVSFGQRPLLILFMVPIILSAVLGGFGPGMLATVVAALGIDYYGIPPLRSFLIKEPFDLFQWFMLIASGILASYLSEMLHLARRRAEERRISQEFAQEALRLSEERFQLAMRGANDGLWDWNMLTDEVYYSPRWKSMLGYREDELAHRLDTWKRLVDPDDQQRTLALVDDLLAGRSDRLEVEFRMRHQNGEYLDILSRAFPVRDAAGRIVRLVGTHVDISQRKEAEAQIQALNAELEQRVEQRTAELVAANAELESFAYAVSHDLRAPLRAMSGFSQALIEDYGDTLTGEARVYLDQIIAGSRRMGDLVDGLLTLSRSTRSQLQRQEVDLSAMAQRLLHGLAKEEPGRRVEWQVEEGLLVQGDAAMLEVALRNLLDNSWKYTSRREKAAIRVFSREEEGQRFICIADDGAGFEAAHAAKLFQPFQRLHRQEEFPGIGIGLATAQRIVHRHGGTIHAKGQRDRGATFCFSLPRYSQTERTDHEE